MLTRNIFRIFILSFLIGLAACSPYNKILKSSDYPKKYEAAIKYYEKGSFDKALALLEELMTAYRGSDKAEKIAFYIAYSNYNMGYYELASFYFKSFVRTYPMSKHAEECAFMTANCFYLTSPAYSLDAADTKSAIREFQLFVNQYPNSERVKEANIIIDKMRDKLEKKSYAIAKQYYNLAEYQAAVVAFNNMMKDFPDTKYKEELSFLVVKSSYLLALNSIDQKKAERFNATMEAYLKFSNVFPSSEYLRAATDIYENASKQKQKLKT